MLLAAAVLIALLVSMHTVALAGQHNTLLLPVTDEVMYPISALGGDDTVIYASAGATSVNLPEITVDVSGSHVARVQAVNSDGTVVAQTAGKTMYNGEFYATDLYMFEALAPGTYRLNLIWGTVENVNTQAIPYVLQVQNAPLVTGGYLRLDATAGAASEVNLYIDGYTGNPDNYRFALVQADDMTEIACSAVYSGSYEQNWGQYTVSWLLTPQAPLAENTEYYLQISADKGNIYTNQLKISATAYSRPVQSLAVLTVAPDDSIVGGLTVTAGGVKAGAEYTVEARLGDAYDGELLYSGKLVPQMNEGIGSYAITLSRNGLVLPISTYGNNYIYVTVSNTDGESDNLYYRSENSYLNQYASLDITQTGNNAYSFKLMGCNMLLDIYEKDAISFTLRYYDQSSKKLTAIAATYSAVQKATYNKNDAVYYTFSGSFTTDTPLQSGTYYRIFYGEDELAVTDDIEGAQTETDTFDLGWLSIRQMDYNNAGFWFNFDQMAVTAEFYGANGTVTAALLDVTDGNKAVAEADGVPQDDGEVLFMLAKPAAFAADHTYTLQFTNNGQTVNAADYSKRYAALSYIADVVEPTYYYVTEPIFAGDKELTFYYSDYSIKNLPADYVANHKFNIVNKATEIGVTYSEPALSYSNGRWLVKLALDEPLTFGSYTYGNRRTFEVLPAGAVVLGNTEADNSSKTLVITGCSNLAADAAYTGVLYSRDDAAAVKPANMTLGYVSPEKLTVSGLPTDLPNGSYTIEVQQDGVYIGAVSCYISWNTAKNQGPAIKGYYEVRNGSYYNLEEILYFTDRNTIYLQTYLPGYAYVRYAEDKSFAGVDYKPVRDFYDQSLTLGDGDGVKTVYVQFKAADGSQSAVYSWTCNKVAELEVPAIVSAKLLVDDAETSLVPKYSEFKLELVSAAQLTSAYAEFIENDGSKYYSEYPLTYKGQVANGYSFVTVLNSDDWPFYSSNYNFAAVKLYLTDIAGDTVYAQQTLPITFGSNEIKLDAWGSSYNLYINTTDFTLSGVATPNTQVTVQLGYDKTQTVTADGEGKFSIAFTGLTDNRYSVYVHDTTGLSTYNALYVDTVAPVLNSLKATAADNGNAVITWDCTEANIAYYLIWRNDVLVKGEADAYTDTSYIAANVTDAAFKVVAVDEAGNKSAAKQVALGDDIAPTAPGTPTLTAHGTKFISFNWAAATDNVAVYKYLVYRDGGEQPIAELSYNQTAYTDSSLTAAAHTYTVYATDRAGNQSAGATATLQAAELKIASSTVLAAEYVKEEYPKGINVTLVLDTADAAYDLAGATAKLQYKLKTAADWAELDLAAGKVGHYSGIWQIEDIAAGEYTVRFMAADSEGTQVAGTEMTVNIKQDEIPPTVSLKTPAAGETMSGKAVSIMVTAEDNVGVNKIVLYYAAAGSTEYTEIATLTNAAGGKTYRPDAYTWVASALASGDYTIKAVAYDLRANASTPQQCTVTLDNTPPPAPTNVTVTGTSRYIKVMWDTAYTPPEDFEQFNVYRAEALNGEYTLLSGVKTIGYYDDGTSVEAGKPYYYYVTAIDKYGNESAPMAGQYAVLTADNQSPTIGDMLPAENAKLRKDVSIRVTAADNYRLSKMVLDYRPVGSGDDAWQQIAEVPVNGLVNNTTFVYDWNIAGIAEGEYLLRATVWDDSINDVAEGSGFVANAPAQITRTVKILPYNAPKAPVLQAQNAYKAAHLSWTYPGDSDTLARYVVYKTDAAGTERQQVATVAAGAGTNYTVKLAADGSGYFMVAAVDRYGAAAYSNVVAAQSVGADTEKPVAVMMPETLTAAVGVPFEFSATGSSDNDVIAAYKWSFGDGAEAEGSSPNHTYTAAGTYTVSLTVLDEAGNSATAEKTMTVYDVAAEDAAHALMTVTVVNGYAEGTPAVAGAEVKVFDGKGFETTVITDTDGRAVVIVPHGSNTVSAVAQGYVPATRSVAVKAADDGTFAYKLAMTPINVSTVDGSLSHTEMTYNEILAAGIDVNDPDNEHVWKFEATFSFVAGPALPFDLPVTGYFNQAGKFVGGSGWGWTSCGGSGSGGGGGLWGGNFNIGLFPISENFVLVIYGEAHWLKEMYNVELLVINNSYSDDITDCVATLDLPEGLSLAAMKGAEQQATQTIGTIGHKVNNVNRANTAKANWYVRGDKEGEYNLTATVTGNNPEAFCKTFTTDKPVKVYAGSALHLQITAEDIAYRGEEYHVQFKLQNVSDKFLYNLSFGITGAEQFKVLQIGDKLGKLELNQDDFGENMTQKIDALAPGGSVTIDFSTTTWFNSALELADLGPFDVGYYLTGVFVTTLEGSTTSIPYDVGIVHARHGSFFEWVQDEVKDYIEGESTSLLDKEFFGDVGLLKNGLKVYKFITEDTTETSSKAVITIEGGYATPANNFMRSRGVSAAADLPTGAIAVYTDADEQNYTISDDGKTLTITGDAAIYVKGMQDGKAKVKVTTYAEDTATGEFIPNYCTLNYTVGNGGSSSGGGGGSTGGGGGGGAVAGNTTTTTTKNDDGSTTTTVTDERTNTVTETTKYKDGSEVTVVSKKDGTVTVTEKTADGVEIKTVTDAKGNVTADVTVPGGISGGTKVELPTDLGDEDGTVSVRVTDKKTGKTTVVKADYADGKVSFTVNGSAHIELLNDFAPLANSTVFTDVAADAYYAKAVQWAVEQGITKGVSATEFMPNAVCTRAQMAAFMWRAAATPQPGGNAKRFTDVAADAYYADAVQWAVEQGITKGVSATEFMPGAVCTRAQMVTFLYRSAQN